MESDPTMVSFIGPGLQPGIKSNVKTHFNVNCTNVRNGELDVTIMNLHDRREFQPRIVDNRDGTYRVECVYPEPGKYIINFNYGGLEVPHCPMIDVQPNVDVSKIKVFGLEPYVYVSCPAKFIINMRAIANVKCENLICSITDSNKSRRLMVPILTTDKIFSVSYVPFNVGQQTIDILYDDIFLPESPFSVKVQYLCAPEQCRAYGPGIVRGLVNDLNRFTVKTEGAGVGGLDLTIAGKSEVRMTCKANRNGSYSVEYVPTEPGDYNVSIKFAGQHIPGSPFSVPVKHLTDSENVSTYGPGLEPKMVREGVPAKFVVDTTKAGISQLDVKLKTDKGEVQKPDIKNRGDGVYEVTYQPPSAGSNVEVGVKYGEQDVPGSPFKVKVNSTVKLNKLVSLGPGVANKCTFFFSTGSTVNISDGDLEVQVLISEEDRKRSTCEIYRGTKQDSSKKKFSEIQLSNIPLPSTNSTITAEILRPGFRRAQAKIDLSLKYEPMEVGLHEVYVKSNEEYVKGSPFKFDVALLASGYITIYGPGLYYGFCGEPGNFTIFTKGAGAGKLILAIKGLSKAEIFCHDNKNGTVSVSYLPTAPGSYKISVKFGDKYIMVNPYVFKITDEGRKRSQFSVMMWGQFKRRKLDVLSEMFDQDIMFPRFSITTPSGLEEPGFLEKPSNDRIYMLFIPTETGNHTMAVNHMLKSPFKFDVEEREVGDAKKVKISGNALKEGKTHVENTFSIDMRNAGTGGLSLSMEGLSKAEIKYKKNDDGTFNISYKPTEPGRYIMKLKFADHHVEGSPFTVNVSGEGSNPQCTKIQRRCEAVPITEIGSQCKLTFKIPGITSFDLAATVTSPGDVTEDAEIKEVEDDLYTVAFIPKELGKHTVSVRYKEMHIPGSPFPFTVGPLRDGGAHCVCAAGPGLVLGEQGELCEFDIWTREAGAGNLAVSVEGPSKAQIDFKDRKDGSCCVSYTVAEPGEYIVGIEFNDQHIPDSPHKLYVAPAIGDVHKLEVAEFPKSGVQPDKPYTFFVHLNGAKGVFDAVIVSPSGIEDDCFAETMDSDRCFVRFMAQENGIHNIHVKFNGVHINGSPFRVKVGEVDADLAVLYASNILYVGVHGPKGSCEEVFVTHKGRNNYDVSYLVREREKYIVVLVKWGQDLIPESPYKVDV